MKSYDRGNKLVVDRSLLLLYELCQLLSKWVSRKGSKIISPNKCWPGGTARRLPQRRSRAWASKPRHSFLSGPYLQLSLNRSLPRQITPDQVPYWTKTNGGMTIACCTERRCSYASEASCKQPFLPGCGRWRTRAWGTLARWRLLWKSAYYWTWTGGLCGQLRWSSFERHASQQGSCCWAPHRFVTYMICIGFQWALRMQQKRSALWYV